MIKPFLFLLLVFSTFSCIAQKPVAWYNHILLDVQNLDSSVAFYTKVFQVDTMLCPFPPTTQFAVKWLKVGKDVELHLSQWLNDTTKTVDPVPLSHVGFVHLGFMVISMDAFLKRLNEWSNDYKYGKYTQPIIEKMPYGAKTVMIKDPDGNEIHVIEVMPSKSSTNR